MQAWLKSCSTQDWLADGLEDRSAKTVKKNENVLASILTAIGARRLRELTADDVRQALATSVTRTRRHRSQLARRCGGLSGPTATPKPGNHAAPWPSPTWPWTPCGCTRNPRTRTGTPPESDGITRTWCSPPSRPARREPAHVYRGGI